MSALDRSHGRSIIVRARPKHNSGALSFANLQVAGVPREGVADWCGLVVSIGPMDSTSRWHRSNVCCFVYAIWSCCHIPKALLTVAIVST